MKVAVNRCYGGFSLSPMGVQRYAECKGNKVYFYQQIKYKWRDGYDEYKKVTDIENNNSFSINAYTKDFGDTTRDLDWDYYFNCRPEDRSDVDLISVIEELGDKASGQCANIKIAEIPDGVEYEIEEYDGSEWVSEKHRTW